MPLSRRRLIQAGAASAVLVVVGSAGEAEAMMGRLLDWIESRPAEHPRPGEDPLDFAAWVLPEVTPNEKFYVQSIGFSSPSISPVGWRLRVSGDVRAPLSLGLPELAAMPQARAWATLVCIGNPVGGGQIGNALWEGVPLRAVLERAGVGEGTLRSVAGRAVFRAADGYHDSVPIEAALDGRALLCLRMNGAPLPPDHGAPLRLLVPGVYGLKNVKWVESIAIVPDGHTGYWQGRGWSDRAVVGTASRFEVPRRRVTVGSPSVWLVGSAFAGDRGIRRVEVAYGLGDRRKGWAPARLRAPLGPLAWTLWAFRMEFPGDGFYPAQVRAVDGAGGLQTDKISDPQPGGATGLMELNLHVKGLKKG